LLESIAGCGDCYFTTLETNYNICYMSRERESLILRLQERNTEIDNEIKKTIDRIKAKRK